MPITHKRMRSFSPYRYNVQYARIGDGPNQKPHPYINMAIQPEEHFVLSKKDPEWFVYMINNAYYESDDECMLNLNKVVSTLRIVHKSVKYEEITDSGLKRLEKTSYQTIEVNLNGSDGAEWTSYNKVILKNFMNSSIDCFVLADNEYLKIQKKFTDDLIVIKFSNDFSKNRYETLKAVIYSISPTTTEFSFKKIEADDVIYNEVTDCVYFENKFNTSKVIPLVFNGEGFASTFENPDLMPTKVILKNNADLICTRSDIENKLADLNDQIDIIKNLEENIVIPSADLYNINYEFREYVDLKEHYENALAELNDDGAYINISDVVIYSHNRDTFSDVIQYGVDSKNVFWDGESAIVKHNLNGSVNVIIDDAYDSNPQFRVFVIDDRTIKITFSNPRYVVCNVNVLKVG